MKLALLLLSACSLFARGTWLEGIRPDEAPSRHIVAQSSPGCLLCSCILWACESTVNIAYDAEGAPDSRPGTWGTAAAVQVPIHFDNVPAGYSVQILRVYGDLIGWARGPVKAGTHAGLLWGLFTSQVALSPNVEFGSFGCPIYFQDAVGQGEVNRTFDQTILAGGILPSDDTLTSQQAVFLNDTGQSIHQEATFAIVYQFIKQ